MLDTYTSGNERDFGARYAETFGWLITGDTRRFVHISHTDHSAVYFTQGGKLEYNARIDAGVQFEFIPVDRGWYNTSTGDVVYLVRVPARQWKRGISQNNTQIRMCDGLFQLPVDYPTLLSVFSKEHKQHSYIPGKRCALSKHFAINSVNQVFFYNQVIGALEKDIIVLNDTLVATELTDTINRQGYPLKVSVK